MSAQPAGVGASSSTDTYLPEHGNGGYRTEHYDVELDYRLGTGRLAGRARITAVATQPLTRFTLDLGPFRINRVLIDGRAAARFTHRGHKLNIWPTRPIAAGAEFMVEVRYVGTPVPIPSHWGELGWEQLTDGALVAAQPIGAPSWLPCNDHPTDKASYRITVTAPSAYRVVANGRLVSSRVGASTTTWLYESSEPMASYLATVQIGRYELGEVIDGSVPIRAAVPPALVSSFGHDFGRQAQMMAVFERCFGPYPFAEYAVVVVDEELEIPVEAQGLSIFGANHIDGVRGAENLVAHELAHQWFGNSLTVADWRHIWLNEGLANYAEWLWSEASGSESAEAHAARAWRKVAALPQDLVLADPGVARMFDDRVYLRGALAMHALRRTLGDTVFFAFLADWTTTHRHGTVTTAQFTALAERHAGRTLGELFTPWLHAPALPQLPTPGAR
ncbi:M1 family metallopeptidase [Solihabitans fulvus]|uniref:M1 family metallopeptidase n=1 Tax=Solihabitans fulvus TaxID=1892852 RepID=UPI001CB7623D|nr:M1 family metallopeptidase [Solihabitans fulvus]